MSPRILRRAVVPALAVLLLASLPASAARPVHDSGEVGLLAWHQLDLDTGVRSKCTPSPACGEASDPPKLGGSDLRVHFDVKGTVIKTVPEEGPAKIVRWGATRPTYAQCRGAQQLALAYKVSRPGTWYCARSNSGRIARLKFLGIGTGVGSPTSYDFRWTTWVR